MDRRDTSYTLIRRAMDLDDMDAWRELEETYRGFILHVLSEFELKDVDRDDITQNCMIKLSQNLRKYDQTIGRFRTWLSCLIRNESISFFRKTYNHDNKLKVYGGQLEILSTEKAAEVEMQIEDEWQSYLVSRAIEHVRESFQGCAVDAFVMGLNGASVEEICKAYSLTEGSVYSLRRRVKRQVTLEIQRLIEQYEW